MDYALPNEKLIKSFLERTFSTSAELFLVKEERVEKNSITKTIYLASPNVFRELVHAEIFSLKKFSLEKDKTPYSKAICVIYDREGYVEYRVNDLFRISEREPRNKHIEGGELFSLEKEGIVEIADNEIIAGPFRNTGKISFPNSAAAKKFFEKILERNSEVYTANYFYVIMSEDMKKMYIFYY